MLLSVVLPKDFQPSSQLRLSEGDGHILGWPHFLILRQMLSVKPTCNGLPASTNFLTRKGTQIGHEGKPNNEGTMKTTQYGYRKEERAREARPVRCIGETLLPSRHSVVAETACHAASCVRAIHTGLAQRPDSGAPPRSCSRAQAIHVGPGRRLDP